MVKHIAARVPLKDVSEAYRRSHRLNGVAKASSSAHSKAPALAQKHGRIVNSRKSSVRRRIGRNVNGSCTASSSKKALKKPNKPTCSSEYIVLDIEDDDDDEDPKQTLSVAPASSANNEDDDSNDEALSLLCLESIKLEVEAVKETLLTPPIGSTKPEVEEPKETLAIPPLLSVKPEDKWLCQPSIAQDMYLHAKSIEKRHCFSADYLSTCGSRVTSEMRATLVNWLVEIHGHLKLEPETLHVAVKLLDATLQHYKVGVSRLQLCGLAVFWLAAKLESTPLNARDLLYLMCHKGDVSILIRMEQTVLRVLNFQLQVAEPIFFLNRLMLYDENGHSQEFFNICNYCLDSVVHDISVIDVPPSDLASAALLAGRMIEGRLEWPWALGYATEHWPTPKKLEPLAQKMLQAILDADGGKATYSGAFKKYASRKRFYALSQSEKFHSENLNKIIGKLSNSVLVN